MDNNIKVILDRAPCGRHKVPAGIPCWHIHSTKGGYRPAICNKRAIKAGFNGKIHPTSLRRKSASKS